VKETLGTRFVKPAWEVPGSADAGGVTGLHETGLLTKCRRMIASYQIVT
jgi:hypothetical protein